MLSTIINIVRNDNDCIWTGQLLSETDKRENISQYNENAWYDSKKHFTAVDYTQVDGEK